MPVFWDGDDDDAVAAAAIPLIALADVAIVVALIVRVVVGVVLKLTVRDLLCQGRWNLHFLTSSFSLSLFITQTHTHIQCNVTDQCDQTLKLKAAEFRPKVAQKSSKSRF